MSVEIKDLVDLNKVRRQDFINSRKEGAFEVALSKIKEALMNYDPEKESLQVQIFELEGTENLALCKDIVKHLKTFGIDCEYKYEAGWSDEYDAVDSSYSVVFKF